MAIIKLEKSGYKSCEDMKNLIDYVMSEERHLIHGKTGGTMLLVNGAVTPYEQMMRIKCQYNKVNGRYMRHLIVSLSDYEMQYIGIERLYEIAGEISGNLFAGYQVLYAIHQETGRIHVHMAINTVSFLDGRKLQIHLQSLRMEIKKIISRYVPEYVLNGAVRSEYTECTFGEVSDCGENLMPIF